MAARVAIIADIHVTVPGVSAQSLAHLPAARRAVEALAAMAPDKVVLLGDVTQLGLPAEMRAARELLEPLNGVLEPVTGNHDVLRASTHEFAAAWGIASFREADWGGVPCLLLSSGIDGLPDTEWHGELGAAQRAFVDHRLASRTDARVLVFVHHPVVGTVAESEGPMMGLVDSDWLRDRLARHPKPVFVFSGHTHVGDHQATYVGCPAFCDPPHAFLVLDVAPGSAEVQRFELSERGGLIPVGSKTPLWVE